jgi:hypothetical protein
MDQSRSSMESSLATLRRPDLPWAEKVAYLAYCLKGQSGADLPMPVRHLFGDKEYVREIVIPANTVFIGRVHKQGHLMQLIYGSLQIITEQAERLYEAPDELRTVPGYQTVLYTFTPVIGRTVHENPSGLRDVDALESQIFESVESVLELGARVAQRLLT